MTHKAEPESGPVEPARAKRSPGRPRREISLDEVAETLERLFDQGGYDAVSIDAVAELMSVSRATLYRTVPTKQDLLAILFDRITQEFRAATRALIEQARDPEQALFGLVRLHIGNAVRTRRYILVFFEGSGLPADADARWRAFAREYSDLWEGVVRRAMDAGVLRPADPVVSTRLLLGMCIWVSRWYRTRDGLSPDDIADVAIQLIRQH